METKYIPISLRIAAILVMLPMIVACMHRGSDTKASAVLWDMKTAGLFDSTNKAYPIVDGLVTVVPQSKKGLCPTGLGHLASGKEKVMEISIPYRAPRNGIYTLHVVWTAGGSGHEQFAVLANNQAVRRSEARDGSSPERYAHESFQIPVVKGKNTLTLRFLSGDGLRFQDLALAQSRSWPITE